MLTLAYYSMNDVFLRHPESNSEHFKLQGSLNGVKVIVVRFELAILGTHFSSVHSSSPLIFFEWQL